MRGAIFPQSLRNFLLLEFYGISTTLRSMDKLNILSHTLFPRQLPLQVVVHAEEYQPSLQDDFLQGGEDRRLLNWRPAQSPLICPQLVEAALQTWELVNCQPKHPSCLGQTEKKTKKHQTDYNLISLYDINVWTPICEHFDMTLTFILILWRQSDEKPRYHYSLRFIYLASDT